MKSHIQVIRGLAVIFVVLFHAFPNIFPYGYLGVDVFFAISGYVITNQLKLEIETSFTLKKISDFWRRRLYRLLPSLSVVVGLTCALSVVFLNVTDLDTVAFQGSLALLFLGNLSAYIFSSDYFNHSANPLVHTWSLSVEAQIYLILPFLIYILLKLRNYFLLWITVLVGSIAFGFFLNNLEKFVQTGFLQDWNGFLFYSPFLRFFEVLSGVTAALLPNLTNRKIYLLQFSIVFILIAVNSFVVYGWLNTVLGLAYVSLLCSLNFSRLSRILSLLSWIGDRSYSIYLVHLPIIVFFDSSIIDRKYLPNEIRFVVVFSAIIFLGEMLFKNIENRYRIRRSRLGTERTKK